AVCGGRLGPGGAGALDWMERTRSGATGELGGSEHALPFIPLGANQKFSQQSVVVGCRANSWRLAAALRICAGVAGDFRGGGTLPGNLLPGRQLDSPGGDARRRTDGPSQSPSLRAEGDLRVSVSGGLSIVSTGEERWSSSTVSSDGERSCSVTSRPAEKPGASCANVRQPDVLSLSRRPRSGMEKVHGRRSKKKSKRDKKRRKNSSASIAACCPDC